MCYKPQQGTDGRSVFPTEGLEEGWTWTDSKNKSSSFICSFCWVYYLSWKRYVDKVYLLLLLLLLVLAYFFGLQPTDMR